MKTEQTISIAEFKSLLPENAKVTFKRKKGQTGGISLELDVKIIPSLSEKEYDVLLNKIIAFYGEDLLEVYTEETGHWFYVYLRMSNTVPTTITI
jgi:hypothetical protein